MCWSKLQYARLQWQQLQASLVRVDGSLTGGHSNDAAMAAAVSAVSSAWDGMHTTEWRRVDGVWRVLYVLAARLRAACLAVEGRLHDALKMLDMALIMGGPAAQEPTYEFIARLTAALPPEKRRDATDASHGGSDEVCAAGDGVCSALLTVIATHRHRSLPMLRVSVMC